MNADMHYRHSNSERRIKNTETGKTEFWKECDICGALQHSNYGFTVFYDMPNAHGAHRRGYCAKCANKYIPILIEALFEINKKEHRKIFAEAFTEGEE